MGLMSPTLTASVGQEGCGRTKRRSSSHRSLPKCKGYLPAALFVLSQAGESALYATGKTRRINGGGWHRSGPSAREEQVGFEHSLAGTSQCPSVIKFLAPQAWESDRRDPCLVIVYPLPTALAL